MNRTTLFTLGIAAGVICLIVAVLYLTGATALGHHIKHSLLFFGLAAVAFLFATVNRPIPSGVRVTR